MSTNRNLNRAKAAKNDEFYTMYEDVQAELSAYAHLFRGKSVMCPCDRFESAFTRYFLDNRHTLGLTRFTATYYAPNTTRGNLLTVSAGDHAPVIETLYGDGDFRSAHVSALMMEHDVVCTNPPFSLFREFVDWLIIHGKEFVIIGNINALTCKNVFGYIQAGRLWTGTRRPKKFVQPDGSLSPNMAGLACWFTNMPVPKLLEPIELWRKYTPEMYPRYDNYNAINVSRLRDIPVDYPGVMGVPITYLTAHCPAQFEIIGVDESSGKGLSRGLWRKTSGVAQPMVKGNRLYSRVFIRHLNPEPAQTQNYNAL